MSCFPVFHQAGAPKGIVNPVAAGWLDELLVPKVKLNVEAEGAELVVVLAFGFGV